MQLGNLILKSVPYVLSIAGGVFVFDFAQKYLHDPSWIDLMNNVAASLLAIPLVFLFYDYSNYLVTRRMNKHQHTKIIAIMDGCLLKILAQMKNIIGLKRIEVPMQDINLNYKKLNLDARYIETTLSMIDDWFYATGYSARKRSHVKHVQK